MKKLVFLCLIIGLVLCSSLIEAATTWYFPEGSTQGFDLWILVTNPNSSSASITYTFYTDTDTQTSTATVDANSRYTLWVNTIAGLDEKPISTKVECTNGLHIFAERAMYWPKWYGSSGALSWEGGHTSRGVTGEEGNFENTLESIITAATAAEADPYEITQPSEFPIVISDPGSFYLSENISCSSTDVDSIIEITCNNVTLDLNGFTITGPGQSATGTTHGIYAEGEIGDVLCGIKVKNGTVNECSAKGVYLLFTIGSQVSDLMTYNNGSSGVEIYASANALIKDVQSINNDDYGICLNACNYSVISDCICTENNYGILCGGDGWYNRIDRNHAGDNTTGDIYVFGSHNVLVNNSSEEAILEIGTNNRLDYNIDYDDDGVSGDQDRNATL